MWDLLKKFNWSVLSIIWLAIILFLLLFDMNSLDVQQPRLFPHADKVVHAGLFGVWAFCLSLACIQRYKRINYTTIMLLIFLIAAATEIIQDLTTYRSGDHWDLIADIVGGSIGLFIIRYFFKKCGISQTP